MPQSFAHHQWMYAGGKPVDIVPPSAEREISGSRVSDVKVAQLVPATPMLKAVLDIRELIEIS